MRFKEFSKKLRENLEPHTEKPALLRSEIAQKLNTARKHNNQAEIKRLSDLLSQLSGGKFAIDIRGNAISENESEPDEPKSNQPEKHGKHGKHSSNLPSAASLDDEPEDSEEDEEDSDEDEDDSVEKNFMNYATEIEDGLYVLSSKRDPGDPDADDPQHLRAIQDLIKKYPVEMTFSLNFKDPQPNFNRSILNYVFYDDKTKSVVVYNINDREDGMIYDYPDSPISDRLDKVLDKLLNLYEKYFERTEYARPDLMGDASQKMLGYQPNLFPLYPSQSLSKKSAEPVQKKSSEPKGVGRKKR